MEYHNLLLGIVVNQGMAVSKARTIPVIRISINKYNVWVRQPLLATKIYDVECDSIEYRATMDWERENITIRFQPVPSQLIDINSCKVEAGTSQPTNLKIEKPEFGPRHDTYSASFDFKTRIDQLPFKLNIGKEANLMQDQQCHFMNLVMTTRRSSCMMKI